jgi:hypothetical protein
MVLDTAYHYNIQLCVIDDIALTCFLQFVSTSLSARQSDSAFLL